MKRHSFSVLCGLFSISLLVGYGGHHHSNHSPNNKSDACKETINDPYPRSFTGTYFLPPTATTVSTSGSIRLVVTADGTVNAFVDEGTANARIVSGTANLPRESFQITGSVPAANRGTESLRIIGTYAIDACVTQAQGEFTVASDSGTLTGSFAAGPTLTGGIAAQ